MRRRPILLSASLLVTALLIPLVAEAAGAATPDPEVPPPGPALEVAGVDAAAIFNQLVYKPITTEQNDWLSQLAARFGQDDNYTSAEISLDRSKITVTWFGRISPELERLIDAPPPGTVVAVQESSYPGGVLREIVARAFASPPEGTNLVSGSVNPDGSGVSFEFTAKTDANLDVDAIARELAGDIPATITVTKPVTPYYGRWDDPYHIGGGFIYNTASGAGCTSGFATIRGGTQKGMMTAAHCGAPSDVFGRSKSVSFPTGGLWAYGTAALRTTASDGLIIEDPSNHFQPYVWASTWNDNGTSLLPVTGVATLVVGSELCFSGSYSGFQCGSVVDNASATWNLGGDLTSVSGVRSTSSGDAAGQGDSGGSGVVLAYGGPTPFHFLAGSIVSGGPGSPSSTCPGKPVIRVCGPVVFSGRASDIAAQTGVSIQLWP